MSVAIVEALERKDAIDVSRLAAAQEAAAYRDRKVTQRREFATLMRSIKTMVREET